MQKVKLPPKTPPPEAIIMNHHSINFCWKDIIERISLILPPDDSKCVIELSLKKINNFDEPWLVKYTGYAINCDIEDLDQDSVYSIRIRLRNKRGWGEYSEDKTIQTPKEPVTGDDLHRAIIMDDEALLQKLLESGNVKFNVPDRYDYTPLMSCTIRNMEKLLKCLLDFGVDLDVQNKSGKTALMLAANKANTRMIQLLLNQGANPKIKDKIGMTALFYAVDAENVQIVRMLIDHGCDVNDVDTESAWTPLLRLAVLANNGNPKIGQLLIQSGANINYQDIYGQTALVHCSFHTGHSDLAKVLINAGAKLDIKNKSGHDAYQIARSMNNTGVISVIEDVLKAETSLEK